MPPECQLEAWPTRDNLVLPPVLFEIIFMGLSLSYAVNECLTRYSLKLGGRAREPISAVTK